MKASRNGLLFIMLKGGNNHGRTYDYGFIYFRWTALKRIQCEVLKYAVHNEAFK